MVKKKLPIFILKKSGFHPPQVIRKKKTADHYLSCLEDSTLIVGNEQSENEFYMLYQKFPRLQTLTHAIMQSEISKHQEMLTTYKTNTPEQRYLNLLKYRPELIQRAPYINLQIILGLNLNHLAEFANEYWANNKIQQIIFSDILAEPNELVNHCISHFLLKLVNVPSFRK